MSFKDFVDKNVAVVKTLFSKPTVEPAFAGAPVEEDHQPAGITMRQQPPQKKGLKRKVIIGAAAGVGVIATTMMVSGVLSTTKSKQPTQQEISEGVTQNALSPASKMPSKYSDMAKYNQQNNMQVGQQPGQQQAGAMQNLSNGAGAAPYSSAQPSQIVDSGYRSSSWSAPSGYSQTGGNYSDMLQQASGGSSTASNVPDYVSSAIHFTLGNNASSDSGTKGNGGSYVNASSAAAYQQGAPNTLYAGTVIPATLITGINSDVAGDIVAQVRQNVYDSATGQTLLIPQGSRLIGTYSQESIGVGKKRLMCVFNRIILPNGMSIALENQKGTDSNGYPGLVDQVDNHSSSLYGAAFMTTALTALASSASGGQGQDNRSPGQEAIAGGISNILNMAGKVMDKNLNIAPTITIRPGTQFSVFLNKDLGLQSYN